MAKRVNMNGSDDPFYRYTMPAIEIKVEGTTKMIKTVLTNIENVAASCGRPVDYLVTFFGQELSAASKVDTKIQKAYVTGAMKLEDIQACCFKFINNYVMCGTCNNPETVVTVSGKKKSMTIVLVCKGCGAKTTLDATDRFVKFMTLHPPALTKQEQLLMGDTLKKSKKSKEAEEPAAAVESADTAPVEKKKKKKKKVVEEDEDDDDWCMDVSEEAVKARAEAANVEALNKAAEKATAALSTKKMSEEPEVASAAQSIATIQVADEEVEDIDDI